MHVKSAKTRFYYFANFWRKDSNDFLVRRARLVYTIVCEIDRAQQVVT